MKRFRLFRGPEIDPELAKAQRRALASQERSERDLAVSTRARAEARELARELARHNSANRYADWLEVRFLGGAR